MSKKVIVLATILMIAGMPTLAAEPAEATTFESIVNHYEAIRLALVSDSMDGIQEHANQIASLAGNTQKKFRPAEAGIAPEKATECLSLLPEVRAKAKSLAATKELKVARDVFGDLSALMVRFSKMGSAETATLVYYCPMVKENWLQLTDEVGNPYYGQKMAKCGQLVED